MDTYRHLISSSFISHCTASEWGHSILIMEKTGKAFARLYWYHDDNDTVYLDWLSVVEECRRRGVGRELQEMREKIGQNMGAKTACLMVENNTWMHDWYARRGYKDWKDVENYSNFIWMKKLITPKLEQ